METTTITSMNFLNSLDAGTVYELRWNPNNRTIEIKLTDKLYDERRKEIVVIVDGADMSMFDADVLYIQDFVKNAITGKLDDSPVLNS